MIDIEIEKLRERCKDFYQQAQRKAIMRTGSPVDDLCEFIQSELAAARAGNDAVRAAYNEGFMEGTKEHTTSAGGNTWQESRAYKNLSRHTPTAGDKG